MKQRLVFILSIVFLFCFYFETRGITPFKFVVFSDLHVSTENKDAQGALKLAVEEVNTANDLDFVLIAGDITQMGDSIAISLVRDQISKLRIPVYITAGNHDVQWENFYKTPYYKVFGNSQIFFRHKGLYFCSIISAPQRKYGKGHFNKVDLEILENNLIQNAKNIPVIFFTHYPLLNGDVDNAFAVIHLLSKFKTKVVLSGHYHRNVCLSYGKIPGIVLRSVLENKDGIMGYSIVSVNEDEFQFFEKRIDENNRKWMDFPINTDMDVN